VPADLKVVILAGGFGSRISEDSSAKPKPMLEIGGMPILWHIMKNLYGQGLDDFVILTGYRASVIAEFFANYRLHNSDVTFDSRGTGETMVVQSSRAEHWRVTLLDTGLTTMTGGRVKRAQPVLGSAPFLLTYGDGLADVDIAALWRYHVGHGRAATLTAVQPQGRFGFLDLNGDRIESFREKAQSDVGWINGGFMILSSAIFPLIAGDAMPLEREPLERLADAGELMAYRHTGFWQCMDTPRDHKLLEDLWQSGSSPWRNW